MSCGKACEKLWENYLIKYGDFRERSRMIRNDRHCFVQLPRIKRQPSNSRNRSVLISGYTKSFAKCDPLLPPECCHSSMMKHNPPIVLNQSDREKLEKVIEAENFPDNIFPASIQSQISPENETEFSTTANLHRLTSSIISKNSVNYSITENDEGSSISKSELRTTSQDPTASRMTNPYTQLIKHLRRNEKSKHEHLDTNTVQRSSDSMIDANTHRCIEQFLSFVRSLDDTIDPTFDESTLITLFSIDNHLSSSMYVPMSIEQVHRVPTGILQSLRTTPGNEHILEQIQSDLSKKTLYNRNIKSKSLYLDAHSHPSYITGQDNELLARLSSTYTIQAFRDFVMQHNQSTRLPKLFHDLDQWSRK